jgi:hypothetical protein
MAMNQSPLATMQACMSRRNQYSRVRINGALSASINALVQIRQKVELNCHDLPVRMEGSHGTHGIVRGVSLKDWRRGIHSAMASNLKWRIPQIQRAEL